ncbi:uncharacterized protein M421DRAFT_425876 [Didymella exigua CBS 183.55]|uniref:Uncharacterized protein n=1 Tax=Didymella exigua CBS 183.55 TaxID=1150837 RepID=A0A6A5R5F0_9PLEO|nr:uncharacterized protein M421DRAFT_425876 [Didymella exigua CBS 183.55]KAF1923351.1 hypothetical protein M421DRAFT_425876 [Didymella exigua CBS 183.55]
MIFATFALFGLIATSSAIGPIAKFRPNTPPARPQTQPKLPNPNSNKLPSPAKPAPGQEQVQANNVGGLDKRLKEAQDIINLSDIGEDIEEAILGTAQSTTVKCEQTFVAMSPVPLLI